MATIRYDDVPYVVTLTNDAALVEAKDAGSAQRNKQYIGPDRTVQFYKTNSFVTVAHGDAVKVTAETSEEAEYFKTFEGSGFTVALKGASEE